MSEFDAIPRQMLAKFKDPKWGAEQLEQIGIFKKFSHDELKDVWGIGEVKPFKAQSHAVIEGEPSRGLYIILFGNFSVYKNDTVTGAMHRLAYMDVGAAFGELSLFDDAPRSATVVADTFSYLFYLDAKVFEDFLDEKGDEMKSRFFQKCAEDMAERFRVINADYITSQQLLWKYALRRSKDPTEASSQVSEEPEEMNLIPDHPSEPSEMTSMAGTPEDELLEPEEEFQTDIDMGV